jgi:hypothetical protein
MGMGIYDKVWATLSTPGGSPYATSASFTWRWPQGVNLTSQIAMNGAGGASGAIGVSSYVQSGQYQQVNPPAAVFFMDNVTEVEISIWAANGWMSGSACGYLWD